MLLLCGVITAKAWRTFLCLTNTWHDCYTSSCVTRPLQTKHLLPSYHYHFREGSWDIYLLFSFMSPSHPSNKFTSWPYLHLGTLLLNATSKACMVAYYSNSGTQEVETRCSCIFEANVSYRVRSCLKNKQLRGHGRSYRGEREGWTWCKSSTHRWHFQFLWL